MCTDLAKPKGKKPIKKEKEKKRKTREGYLDASLAKPKRQLITLTIFCCKTGTHLLPRKTIRTYTKKNN